MADADLVPPPRGTGVAFVTGAGGFIGRHVASAFLGAGWNVVGFGHRRPAADPVLGLRETQCWVGGRVSREGLSRAAAEIGAPEIVVHAAGGATVGASIVDPAGDRDRSVGSTREVVEFLAAAATARLVSLSSAAVYGDASAEAIAEDAPTHPISPYGEHKLEAERLVADAAARRDVDAAIVRFFSVYGPGNRKQLLWDIASRLNARPSRLELSGTGEEVRDFLYVDDAVRMIGLLSGDGRREAPLVVNCGSGKPVTVRALAEALCRTLQTETAIVFEGAGRAGDPLRLVSDPTVAMRLGLVRTLPLAEGLDRFARWSRTAISRQLL